MQLLFIKSMKIKFLGDLKLLAAFAILWLQVRLENVFEAIREHLKRNFEMKIFIRFLN